MANKSAKPAEIKTPGESVKAADNQSSGQPIANGLESQVIIDDTDPQAIIQSLREEVASKESLNLQLKKDLSDAMSIIEDQHKALSIEDSVSEGVVVSHGGKKYRVTAPVFSLGGLPIAAADLKDNKDYVETLVKQNSSILQLIK